MQQDDENKDGIPARESDDDSQEEEPRRSSVEGEVDTPEEKANTELLDPEIRKDTHEDDRDDPDPKDLEFKTE